MVLVVNVLNGKLGTPATAMYAAAFILDLVTFIVALTTFPYSGVCGATFSLQCHGLKAAIGLDGVLWHAIWTGRLTDCRSLFLLNLVLGWIGGGGRRTVVSV